MFKLLGKLIVITDSNLHIFYLEKHQDFFSFPHFYNNIVANIAASAAQIATRLDVKEGWPVHFTRQHDRETEQCKRSITS